MDTFKSALARVLWIIAAILLLAAFFSSNSPTEQTMIFIALLFSPIIVYFLVDFIFETKPPESTSDLIKSRKYVVYDEFIKSPEWEALKKQKIDEVGGKCQVCGRKRELEVHHWTHKTLGREKMSDLVAVCKECHEKIEAEKEKARKEKVLYRTST